MEILFPCSSCKFDDSFGLELRKVALHQGNMVFIVPSETLAYWMKRGPARATDGDIAMLETCLGLKAPPSYVDFMKTYGCVEFDFDVDCRFDYVYEDTPQPDRRSKAISFIKSAEKAIRYYEGLQKDEQIGLPPHLLPFAMDRGQGELLIEFGQPTERVFYWDFDAHDWESGVTRIGLVADTMYDFINNLRPYDG